MKYILFLTLIIGIISYTDNEKQVWDFLINRARYTKAGAAGLMANLKVLSGIRSVYYEDAYKPILGLSDQEYVDQVNDGRYPQNEFIQDGVGFGLALWSYYSRKENLMNTWIKRGFKLNIGDLGGQLEFLVIELRNYWPRLDKLLKSSNSVYDCAYRVLFDYVNPKDQSYSFNNIYNFRSRLL